MKTDDLTLIYFQTAEEFMMRSAYVPHIDSTKNKPKNIIGKYAFSREKEVKCGLCNTNHMHGYVIETDTKLETNIGQDCGRKHFDVEFDQVEAAFKKREVEQSRRNLLSNLLAQRTSLLTEAEVLLDGVEKLTKDLSIIVSNIQREPSLYAAFLRTIKQGGAIQVQSEYSKEYRSATGSNQRYYIETLANLDGTSAIGQGGSLQSKLKYQVIAPLRELTEMALSSLDARALEEKARLVGSIKNNISEARRFIESARSFLTPSNLHKLTFLGETLNKLSDRGQRILARFGKI